MQGSFRRRPARELLPGESTSRYASTDGLMMYRIALAGSLLVLALGAGCASAAATPTPTLTPTQTADGGVNAGVGPGPSAVEMVVEDLVLDPAGGVPVVLLKVRGGDRYLPIWIGSAEAGAIVRELTGFVPPRPQTHDLLKTVVAGLDAEVRYVFISEIRGTTYHARILLTRQGETLEVDARSSDAIALALRMNAPIYTHEQLLGESGVDTRDLETPLLNPTPLTPAPESL